jgi:UDP-glucuronate 4-epimerase
LDRPPIGDATWSSDRPDPGRSSAPYRLYNIGNHNPVELGHFVATLERALDRTAVKRLLPMQPGDVPATYADVADLERDVGFRPQTGIEEGIGRFVAWYKSYYNVG